MYNGRLWSKMYQKMGKQKADERNIKEYFYKIKNETKLKNNKVYDKRTSEKENYKWEEQSDKNVRHWKKGGGRNKKKNSKGMLR